MIWVLLIATAVLFAVVLWDNARYNQGRIASRALRERDRGRGPRR